MKTILSWKGMLLAELRKGRAEAVARGLCGVGAERVIQEKRADPEFAAAYEQAHKDGSTKRMLRW